MKKLFVQNLILLMLALSLTHCSSATSPSEDEKFQNLTLIENDSLLNGMVLTITHVKKPWYGLRFLMVSRFKKSIPEYASIRGLRKKSYHISGDGKTFGGIYLWQTKEEAANWFNPSWFSRIKEKYGEDGVVEYYTVKSIEHSSTDSESTENLWSVLSTSKISTASNIYVKGLVSIITMENQMGTTYYVSVWKTEDQATQYFHDDQSALFFDTPVHIDNSLVP